jgi:hypothetical protein
MDRHTDRVIGYGHTERESHRVSISSASAKREKKECDVNRWEGEEMNIDGLMKKCKLKADKCR